MINNNKNEWLAITKNEIQEVFGKKSFSYEWIVGSISLSLHQPRKILWVMKHPGCRFRSWVRFLSSTPSMYSFGLDVIDGERIWICDSEWNEIKNSDKL